MLRGIFCFFSSSVRSHSLWFCQSISGVGDRNLFFPSGRERRKFRRWRHPTTVRSQLYGHLPPITKTIQVRRTRHAGHCWRSRDELIRDVLLWIPTHGRAKAGRPARTYIQQLCEDTGCCPEDLPRAMNDREEWRERVRDIRASNAIWWWWYIYIYIYKECTISVIKHMVWFGLVWFGCYDLSIIVRYLMTNLAYLYIIIIIIIMSRHQHWSPWPSPATLLYRPSLPVGLQGYIPYKHTAAEYRI